MARQLTGKQIRFAHYVAEGLTASEAYRRAYATDPGRDSKRCAEDAKLVRDKPHVHAYIEQLKAETKARAQLTRDDIIAKLDGIIIDPDVAESARVQAIKTRNGMTGDNAPQEINVFGLSDLLAVVRKGRR